MDSSHDLGPSHLCDHLASTGCHAYVAAMPDPLSLEQRVARLEQLVARLLERPGESDAGPPASSDEPPQGVARGPISADSGGASAEVESAAGLADHGERWLGRVGVAFVVLAFGFLFRYALDQGWIGPAPRLVLGLLAGTAMLVVGLRLEGSRERYSHYLLGGSIALYYLVGFASYELYGLVPFALAFAFMCVVTVLAFILAERQRLPSLAGIGASGGLLTPFLVSTGSVNVPTLVAYTMLVLVGSGAIQFLRGWRSLLLVLGFGGLSVIGFAASLASGPPAGFERVMVVIGIFAVWALFGVIPLLRAHLHRSDPDTWPEPPLGRWWTLFAPSPRMTVWLLRVACVAAASITVAELGGLFSSERATYGVLFGVASVVYLALGRSVVGTPSAFNAAAETASILLILAVSLTLFDYRVMLPLAVAGMGMHLASKHWGLRGVGMLAHVLFAQLVILLVSRSDLGGIATGSPFGVREVGALGAIVLMVMTSFVLETALAKRLYRIAAHVGFLVWLVTQFGPTEYGQELISLSWGAYGIALLLLSLRLGQKGVQLAGLATLGLVAGKLLIVDMAQVDVIWRILLFMGFGGAFLGLSYLINRTAKSD